LIVAILSVYYPRNPKASPLWRIFDRHYDDFEKNYAEKFEKRYGYFRPVIGEAVRAYLRCGDLKEGFARIRCPNCGNDRNFLVKTLQMHVVSVESGRVEVSEESRPAVLFQGHYIWGLTYRLLTMFFERMQLRIAQPD